MVVGLAPRGRCLPASGCQEQSGFMDMSKWCLVKLDVVRVIAFRCGRPAREEWLEWR